MKHSTIITDNDILFMAKTPTKNECASILAANIPEARIFYTILSCDEEGAGVL